MVDQRRPGTVIGIDATHREDDADHDTLWKAKQLVPSRFDYVPARHPALRYGMTLNDRGYFWESQEVLEAVWAAAPQRSASACTSPSSNGPARPA